MGLPIAAEWWQEVGGWIVILGVFGWLIGGFVVELLGRHKIRDARTGNVSKAWWVGRRRRKKPPGPFLKS